MTKLYRPEFVYLTQGYNGEIRWHIEEPRKDLIIREWVSDHMITVSEGAQNPDWENTLIDFRVPKCAVDGYTFQNGILERVDVDGNKNAVKDRC